MVETIVGVMKKVAEQEVLRVHTTELGIVSAVFPHGSDDDHENYQVSVTLKNKKQADGNDFELRQVPVATPYMGLVAIPNVGDLVLVSFIGGDVNAPVIIGRLYNNEDRPPLNKKQEFLLQHSVKDGPSIKLDAKGKVIVTSKDKKTTVTVANDKISIVSNQDLVVDAKAGKLTLHGNEVEITADAAMKLKGATIDLN